VNGLTDHGEFIPYLLNSENICTNGHFQIKYGEQRFILESMPTVCLSNVL
jgi:hypothetical protein